MITGHLVYVGSVSMELQNRAKFLYEMHGIKDQ